MISPKLPEPIDLKGKGNLSEIVEFVYQNYFKYDFMDKHNRERLFGKFIFLELDFIDYRPERFWHLISFAPSAEKYTVNPCINTEDQILCNNIKHKCDDTIVIPNTKRLKNRSICIYRLRRIHWINQIIKMANKKDDSIKIWYTDKRDRKNKLNRRLFIRFQDGMVDYLLVLLDNRITGREGYKFITAYPVVHNGTKRGLDRHYKHFKKSI